MPRDIFRKGDLERYLKDGVLRSMVEQGLLLGWGDEAEAYVRSKLSDRHVSGLLYPEGDPNNYENLLKQIRGETEEYYEDYPTGANVAELAGSVLPFFAVPGGSVARTMATAGVEGGIYGAGTAEEGGRLSEGALNAVLFALMGGGMHKGAQLAKRGVDKLSTGLSQVPASPGYAGGGLVGTLRSLVRKYSNRSTDENRRKLLKAAAAGAAVSTLPNALSGRLPDSAIQDAIYDKIFRPAYESTETTFGGGDLYKVLNEGSQHGALGSVANIKSFADVVGVPEGDLSDFMESHNITDHTYALSAPDILNALLNDSYDSPKRAWENMDFMNLDYADYVNQAIRGREVNQSAPLDEDLIFEITNQVDNDVVNDVLTKKFAMGELAQLIGEERLTDFLTRSGVKSDLFSTYSDAIDYGHGLGAIDDLVRQALSKTRVQNYAEGGRVDKDRLSNYVRAALGQGAMLGHGDELEAAIKAPFSDETYEELRDSLRRDYGEFADDSVLVQPALEFGGAGATAAGLFALTPRGRRQALSQGIDAIIRNALLGGVVGAGVGAGNAEEDEVAGGLAGSAIGTALGAVVPAVTRGGRGMARWVAERAFPTASRVNESATRKLSTALGDIAPLDIETILNTDRALSVPSMVLNADQGLTDLAEAVTQRTGTGSKRLTQALGGQRTGVRERLYSQVRRALHPGNYYQDEARFMQDLRANAAPLYEQAYAQGMIDDPRIDAVLQVPQFRAFFQKAQEIAKLEETAARLRGDDPTPYQLQDLYEHTGGFNPDGSMEMKLVRKPDVRTLDYIKRGMDTVIDRGFNGEGISKPEAAALRDLRKQFMKAIDDNSDAYRLARASYSGDMEVLDALRGGMNDFNRLDHEQVQQLVAGMGPAERDAYRTGVARHLYSRLMDPSGNVNAAQRLIGSPEMQAKLAPLFDSPAQFRFFKAAMEREAELFHQSNRILGGSPTSRREQMRGILEDDAAMGDAVRDMLTGGWWNSVTSMAGNFIRSAKVTDEVADRLAKMLTSRDPDEVAAVVKLLEDYRARARPEALRLGVGEAAATTGLIGAGASAPDE